LVAYRDEAAATPPANLPVNVATLGAETNGLDYFNGRVVWLHGADDAALSPVDVISNDFCPPPVVADLVFGADATTDILLRPDPYNLGLDITDNDMCDAAVLFRVGVGGVTVVVPVDEGVDAELDVEVWGLPDPFDMPVRLAPVSDCTGVEDRPDCVVDGSLGLCGWDDCRPFNCSGLEDGTVCGEPPGSGGISYGWCEDGSCKFAVSDCTGFQDGVVCGYEFLPTAACVDGSCESITRNCDGSEDGTPCLDSSAANYPGTGLCVDGSSTNTAYHCKEPCPETGGAFVCATSARFWCSRRRDLQDSANQERRPSEVVVFAACLSIARLRRRTATVGDESSVTPAGASARTPVERFRMLMRRSKDSEC
jgi:hypothetical protein